MFSLQWFAIYSAVALCVTFLEHIFYHFGYRNRFIIAFKQLFEVPYTLVHEFSHAIVALITSGKIKRITLHHNLSGSVVSSSSNRIGRFLTTLAGYTLPCYIAFLFIWLLHINPVFPLYAYLVIAIFSAIFIRNVYGFFWIIGFISVVSIITWKAPLAIVWHLSYFLVTLLFVAALYGGYRIFLLAFQQPQIQHDASILAMQTRIPAQVWGIVFFLHNILVGGCILYYFLLT